MVVPLDSSTFLDRYRGPNGILFAFEAVLRGFEADGVDERVEVIDDAHGAIVKIS